jgi:hypothetical protein
MKASRIRIPDPGGKKALNPESATLGSFILNAVENTISTTGISD